MRITKKVGLVGATVVALLLALATPAAAGGPYPLEVQSGTLRTFLGDFDLGPEDPPGPCVAPPGDLALYTDADANGGTGSPGDWSVDGGYSGYFQLPGAAPWYEARFTLQGSGQYGPPSGAWDYDLTGSIFAQVDIYSVDGECEKVDFECSILGIFGITSGQFVGTLPNSAVGDTATIDADTVSGGFGPLVASPCPNTDLVNLNGTHAQIIDMVLQHV